MTFDVDFGQLHRKRCSPHCSHRDWTSSDGETRLICEMGDGHLKNAHRYTIERELEISEAFRLPVARPSDNLADELEQRRDSLEDMTAELEAELDRRGIAPYQVLRPPKDQPVYKGAYR